MKNVVEYLIDMKLNISQETQDPAGSEKESSPKIKSSRSVRMLQNIKKMTF